MNVYDIEDITVSVMMKRLLKEKLDTGYCSISYAEIEMLCCMLGIKKEDKND